MHVFSLTGPNNTRSVLIMEKRICRTVAVGMVQGQLIIGFSWRMWNGNTAGEAEGIMIDSYPASLHHKIIDGVNSFMCRGAAIAQDGPNLMMISNVVDTMAEQFDAIVDDENPTSVLSSNLVRFGKGL